jgi:hypothetical protein
MPDLGSGNALTHENLTTYQQELSREKQVEHNNRTSALELESNEVQKLVGAALSLGICLADPKVRDELIKPYSGMMPLERFMREHPCLIRERLDKGDVEKCLEMKKACVEKTKDPPSRTN